MTGIYILAVVVCLMYVIIITSFTYGWFSLKNPVFTDLAPKFSVSIIVPFRNEQNNLEKLLRSVALIDYPEQLLEIVFINDNSNDYGCKLIELYSQSSPFSVRLLNSPENGKKAAITHGISQSKGDIIICTDADCVVQSTWVKEMAGKFIDDSVKLVLGPVAVLGNNSFWNSFQKIEFMSLVLCSAGAVSIQKPIMANGANIAYRKRTFQEVDGYSGNEHIASGDDVFLMSKIAKKFGNTSITFQKSETSIVYTKALQTMVEFLGQRIRWASKSPAYGTPFTKLTAVTVLAMNLLPAFSFFLMPAGVSYVSFFVVVWMIKIIVDFPILYDGSHFFKNRRSLLLLPVIEIITAIFTVIPGILAFFMKPDWKKRRI